MNYFSILMHDSNGLAYNEKVRQKCEELYHAGCRVNHLLACIIDICQEKPISDESSNSIFHIDNALKVLFHLIEYIFMTLMFRIISFNYIFSYVKNYLRNMIQ